jgi:hypothetical protein
MSDPISEDKREAFITGYFSIFLALGLGQFISTPPVVQSKHMI